MSALLFIFVGEGGSSISVKKSMILITDEISGNNLYVVFPLSPCSSCVSTDKSAGPATWELFVIFLPSPVRA
jgi:hypothetical protein